MPLVLFGIRTVVKAELWCSSAEMVYGTTLKLPGEFVEPIPTARSYDPSKYVDRLRRTMQLLRPTPTRQTPAMVHVPADLHAAHILWSDTTPSADPFSEHRMAEVL